MILCVMILTRNLKIIILVVGIVVIICLAILLYFIFRPNPYCDPSLCRKGVEHIGCYGNHWGPLCDSPEIIKFSSDLIKLTVDLHNNLRNEAAKGSLTNSFGETLPMAERMGVISWNDELAYLAKLNTYQCTMKHDKCHNTKEFKFSGQNLGMMTFNQNKPKDFINILVNSWFSEYNVTKNDQLALYSGSGGYTIGHFTALVNELQTQVGCGMTISYAKKRSTVFLACNYSYTNMKGNPVYKKTESGSPCHGCKKGCHPVYKYLCAKGEDIKY